MIIPKSIGSSVNKSIPNTIKKETSPSKSPMNSSISSKLPFRNDVVIFTGNSNKGLADEIASILGIDLGKILVGRFNDG